jgi:histidinol dehydrogenase
VQVERKSTQELGDLGADKWLRGLIPGSDFAEDVVRGIVNDVMENTDEAVLRYTRKYDTVGVDPRPLEVPGEELDGAIRQLSKDMSVVAGLQVAIANVAEVADAGVGEDVSVTLSQGQRITLREIPVESVAVYVPGGRAPYPSTAVMGVVTARAAGVIDVVVCSPPGRDGQIDPMILGTCRLLGVDLFVVMGEDADPYLVALDLLAQAEHGRGSIVVTISPSAAALDAVEGHLQSDGSEASDVSAACELIQSADAREAVELANAYGPEHLELVGEEPEALAPMVRNAGCVMVGAASATAFSDYVAGSNHILPTGGAARWASGLSARHFRRRMSEVRIDPEGAAKLAKAGAPIARAEGFEWHAKSMEARVRENQQ